MEIRRIQIKRKIEETIDTNAYTMTFNTSQIPKEIKIGYQKINIEPYIPNPLMSEVWAPPGPIYTTASVQKMWRIWHNDYKSANCQGKHGASSRDCEIWKKEITKLKQTQKYHLPRSKKFGRDYKICRSDNKNIPTTKKSNLLCVKQVQPQNPRWLPNL